MNFWSHACQYCQQARWLIVAVLTMAFLAWGFWGWREIAAWHEDNAPVMSFGQGTASDTIVRPNDVIIIYQPIKKLRDCEGVIQRIMTGECGRIVVSETRSTVIAGFEGRITIPFQIPHEAIPGPCGFQVRAKYNCNPFDQLLQRQVFVSPIIPFTVKEYGQ